MSANVEQSVVRSKALADPTRVRILALLCEAELSAGDLVDILGQSQPRVSRHLKLLVEAGLVNRSAEGAFAYFRLVPDPVATALLASLDEADIWLARDRAMLDGLRRRREAQSAAFFETHAENWDRLRSEHAPEERVEAALCDALPGRYEALLDLGTGTARALDLLADRCETGLGLDTSSEMLRLARTRLDRPERRHLRVAQGNLLGLDPELETRHRAGFDAAVMHQVLHHLERPGAALRETAKLMRPGAPLVIVDFAPHHLAFLSRDFRHTRLGFSTEEIASLLGQAGFTLHAARDVPPEPGGALTVMLWTAHRRADTANITDADATPAVLSA